MAKRKHLGADGKWRDSSGRFTSPPKSAKRKPPASIVKQATPKSTRSTPKPANGKRGTNTAVRPPRSAVPTRKKPSAAKRPSKETVKRPKREPKRLRQAAIVPPPGAVYLDANGRWRDSKGKFLAAKPKSVPSARQTLEAPWEAAWAIRDRLYRGLKIDGFSYANLPRGVKNPSGKGINTDYVAIYQDAGGIKRRMRFDSFKRFLTGEKYNKKRVAVSEAATEEPDEDLWYVGIVDPKTGDILRVVWEFDSRHFAHATGEDEE